MKHVIVKMQLVGVVSFATGLLVARTHKPLLKFMSATNVKVCPDAIPNVHSGVEA